jgi:hypothetical protein
MIDEPRDTIGGLSKPAAGRFPLPPRLPGLRSFLKAGVLHPGALAAGPRQGLLFETKNVRFNFMDKQIRISDEQWQAMQQELFEKFGKTISRADLEKLKTVIFDGLKRAGVVMPERDTTAVEATGGHSTGDRP